MDERLLGEEQICDAVNKLRSFWGYMHQRRWADAHDELKRLDPTLEVRRVVEVDFKNHKVMS